MSRGFTLIEMVITLAIVGLLASLAFPMAELAMRREREAELRRVLIDMREAIDAYHRAVEEGRIIRSARSSGYPPSLKVLVEGERDAADPNGKARLYFLRSIPRDPMASDPALDNDATWAKREYASSADEPREGEDVFDVHSRSAAVGINGVPYRRW
ncbi:type II secretion system protein [Massilia sp. 2TAF26]|uniref:type II secretion system protein n=1 Tax=Massilia sp. 2TAF26 TaxID=3233012 RepID=UPI003F9A5E77